MEPEVVMVEFGNIEILIGSEVDISPMGYDTVTL
jgi:hypothetical protein